jgi:hypothetical protein
MFMFIAIFLLKIKATVPDGKKVATHVGRVAVRVSGSANIQASVVQGIAHCHRKNMQRNDGYSTKGMQSSTALLSLSAVNGEISRSTF